MVNAFVSSYVGGGQLTQQRTTKHTSCSDLNILSQTSPCAMSSFQHAAHQTSTACLLQPWLRKFTISTSLANHVRCHRTKKSSDMFTCSDVLNHHRHAPGTWCATCSEQCPHSSGHRGSCQHSGPGFSNRCYHGTRENNIIRVLGDTAYDFN
jgi:hypothetical protein